MLSPTSQIKIFLRQFPTDMRRSVEGLAIVTTNDLKHDPLSGNLFMFRCRRRDRLKQLNWDRNGYARWYKQLESGTFEFPQTTDGDTYMWIFHQDLSLLLSGVALRSVQRRKCYAHVA